MSYLVTLAALLMTFSPVSESSTERQHEPLPVVQNLDLERYMGTWYEIARFDHSFQRRCGATKAQYQLKRNHVRVINSCRRLNRPERVTQARGRAFVADEQTNAKLEVSFVPFFRIFGLFSGNYYVIALDENYQYAMVGEPSREFLWILSRTPELDQSIVDQLKWKARELGFNTDKLSRTANWNDL